MEKCICEYSFIPVRTEPSERAEQTTQILFGETFSVWTIKDKWARIKIDFDGYEGWIDAKLCRELTDSDFATWTNAEKHPLPQAQARLRRADGSDIIISGGSETPSGTFAIGGNAYELLTDTLPQRTLRSVALSYLNAPYLWGGRTFFGIDCSGFTQAVNKIMGKALPRDASQQALLGTTVPFVEEAQEGDLAFFDNDEGHITHVGICLGNGEIIHASGCVKIDRLDRHGIFSLSTHAYTHTLRTIKRI